MKKAPTTYQADGASDEQLAFITRTAFCPIPPISATEGHDSVEGLQILADAQGLVLHSITASRSTATFLVARKAASREFGDLAQARHFLNAWAGGCRG